MCDNQMICDISRGGRILLLSPKNLQFQPRRAQTRMRKKRPAVSSAASPHSGGLLRPTPVPNCQPQTKTNSSRPGGTQGSHLFLQSGYGGSRFVLLEVVVFLSVALAPGPVRVRLEEEEEEAEVSQLCLHPADVINPPQWSIFKQRLRTFPRTRAPPAWKMPLLSYARVYHKHTAHFCPIGGASALLSSRHLQHKHDLMSQHNASL